MPLKMFINEFIEALKYARLQNEQLEKERKAHKMRKTYG